MSEENALQFPPRPTMLLHALLRGVIREGDLVVDATAGNGHDTVFLAELTGQTGHVLAFDIQETAIRSATARVAGAGYLDRVTFFHESHTNLAIRADVGSVTAIVFNLGYLPGEDHEKTTLVGETLAALEVSTRILKRGGVLAIICYPGHPAGAIEAAAVEEWMSRLTSGKWRVVKYAALGTLKPAPFLLLGCS